MARVVLVASLALLLSGCMGAPAAPDGLAAEPAQPARVEKPPVGAGETPEVEANATPLRVEWFEGPLESLPTWGDHCPSDVHGVRHVLALAEGATHARLEIAPDDVGIETHAQVFIGGAKVAESVEEGEPLVLDLGPAALAGADRIEVLVWFCDIVQLSPHEYRGALSSFDDAPPAGHRAIVLEGADSNGAPNEAMLAPSVGRA